MHPTIAQILQLSVPRFPPYSATVKLREAIVVVYNLTFAGRYALCEARTNLPNLQAVIVRSVD